MIAIKFLLALQVVTWCQERGLGWSGSPDTGLPRSSQARPAGCLKADVVKALQIAAGEDTGDQALDFQDPTAEELQDALQEQYGFGSMTLEVRPLEWGPRPDSIEELEAKLERAKRQRIRAEARAKIERARKELVLKTLEACRR